MDKPFLHQADFLSRPSSKFKVFQHLLVESRSPALEHAIIRLEADTPDGEGHSAGKSLAGELLHVILRGMRLLKLG